MIILLANFSGKDATTLDCFIAQHANITLLNATTVDEWHDLFQHHKIDCFFFFLDADFALCRKLFGYMREQELYCCVPAILFSSQIDYLFSTFLTWYGCEYFHTPLTAEKQRVLSKLLYFYDDSSRNMRVDENKICQIDTGKEIINLPFRDILFLESSMKKTLLHLKNEVFFLPLPLYLVKNQLDQISFLQTHRSYIINTDTISSIDKTKFPWVIYFAESNKTAFVSRSYKEVAHAALFHKTFSQTAHLIDLMQEKP